MSGPNLQQIPRNLQDDPREPFIDAAAWPSIKKLFSSPDKDFILVQFDYSQAELRVLAALAHDPVLMAAYVNGEDVHQRVAAEAFNVPFDEVTKYQRTVAKTINFGLLYGQGAKKLAKTIGCTEEQAKEFIRIYFEKLPGVRKFIKKTKAYAREHGNSPSPYGRLRRLSSIFSPEQDIVAKAERQAVNSPIQATASDWTLFSISRISKWLEANSLLSTIILTVHDSIILLVHKTEIM
jgi:DNA polymerase-1